MFLKSGILKWEEDAESRSGNFRAYKCQQNFMVWGDKRIQLHQIPQVKSFIFFQILEAVAIKLSVQPLLILDSFLLIDWGFLHTIFKMVPFTHWFSIPSL